MTSERFLSTPSARRATRQVDNRDPRPRHFYPRPPRGGRLQCCGVCFRGESYFYPRPPRGGRRFGAQVLDCPDHISIHALREEGDFMVSFSWKKYRYFYPRPPRGGRRKFRPFISCLFHFYPRPPRGGRRFTSFQWFLSILKFLSTPSARRATMLVRVKVVRIIQFLSTPSARRATCGPARLAPAGRYFYPRPPRGGRRVRVAGEFPRQEFLSTPSARRATCRPLLP